MIKLLSWRTIWEVRLQFFALIQKYYVLGFLTSCLLKRCLKFSKKVFFVWSWKILISYCSQQEFSSGDLYVHILKILILFSHVGLSFIGEKDMKGMRSFWSVESEPEDNNSGGNTIYYVLKVPASRRGSLSRALQLFDVSN